MFLENISGLLQGSATGAVMSPLLVIKALTGALSSSGPQIGYPYW
jgi:hypothetical protein